MKNQHLESSDLWLNAVQVPIMVIDQQGIVIVFNKASEQLSAYASENILGKYLWQTALEIPADLARLFPLSADTVLSAFKTQNLGQSRITWTIETVSDDESIQWVCTGISEAEQQPQYRQMFQRNAAMMIVIDPKSGIIVDANHSAVAFYGYEPDTLVGMNLNEITLQSKEEMLRDLERALVHERDFFVFQHRLVDGAIRDVEVFSSPVDVGTQSLLYSIIVDVTERNLIEEALRNSELQYRQLVELMQEGLAVHSPDNLNTYVNEKLSEMLGYSRIELIDRPVTDFMNAENQDIIKQETEFRRQGNSSKFELAFIHKNGTPVYALVASTPILEEDGTFSGSFSVITDITERKLAEQSLIQSNEELDAFAHTVAHDLKSPISVMMGFANVLESEFLRMSDNELKDYLHSMSRTSDKMITIIDELLLLSEMRNTDEVKKNRVDMEEVIKGTMERINYMREQYGASITVPSADVWIPAAGQAQWIEEVWVNYLSNAIKYGGQPPKVEIGCEDAGEFVRFWVKDNGRGIPNDKLDEVFLPFTRLEQVRIKGHGLGLSIVQRIVHKLGGQVHVESEIGKGSLFSFTLPKA